MAKKVANKKNQFWGTGRRKKSIARVRLIPEGNGNIIINGKTVDEYFDLDTLKIIVKQPLVLTETENKFDIYANVVGGGVAGQAGAVRHGIARAMVLYDEKYKEEIKKAGLLTRDPRMKERKNDGLKKARKAPQFSKR